MSRQVWINGKLYSSEDARVSVFDHGLLYGDGVFEGLRSYGGKVFRLHEHVVRLFESAKAIWLEIPLTQQALCDAIDQMVKTNEIEDGYIRVIVTRGVGHLGLIRANATIRRSLSLPTQLPFILLSTTKMGLRSLR